MSNINDFVIEDGNLLEYNGNDNNVVIPDDGSVTSLGDGCFLWCESLESITIPESVTSLGDDCFYYCTSLKSIEIPASVTTIGEEAFGNCTNLTDVYYTGSASDWAKITIRECNEDLLNATIHYNSTMPE